MLSLTATELTRFMACNGYKSLGGVEPFNPSTEATDEGNAVHWLAEQVFNGANPKELVGQQAPNGLFITDEMVENCSEYLEFITSGDCQVEIDTSIQGNNWEIRGRADCIKYLPLSNELTIADLKYGHRIVEPFENWTLISHSIAWCVKNHTAPYEIKFVIYQPRAFHPQGEVREWKVLYTDVLDYYQRLVSILEHPSPTVSTGAQCYKCKCLSQCPAAQIAVMNAIDVSQMAFDSEINNDKLSWMLDNLKRAQEILKQSYEAYQDLALHRLKDGKRLKGYAIQNALGNTTWDNTVNADFIKTMCGVDITVSKLMTPAQAKKAGVPEDLINGCTYRPDNGFKLVSVDENKLAKKLFGEKK